MTKSNEMTKTEDSPMVAYNSERPEWMNQNSRRGSEDVTVDDITLPRVEILQALSPQLKKSEAEYIEGSEQGKIFNTVSGELYGDSVTVVPIMFRREWIIWTDRKSGGGFKGSFATEVEAERERLSLDSPDDHEVVETHVNFVLIVRESGQIEEAVLSWSRSKCKVSRRLNALIQMTGGDRFGRAYRLSAAEASSTKGDYWTFNVTALGYVSKEVYDRAASVYEAIKGGERKVSYGVEEFDEEATSAVV